MSKLQKKRNPMRVVAHITFSLSPLPYTNTKSSIPERLPSVSVVIPVRRPDKLTTTTTQTNITRKPRRLQGADDHGDNNDAAVHELCYDRPVSSSRSNNEVEGNLRKKHTPSSLMDDAAGACPQSPQKSPDSRFAVTPTEAKEVFGRGVLRIQPYGPRHAYFITFLPDVVQPPSKPSPSELPLEKPSRSASEIGARRLFKFSIPKFDTKMGD
ncbi:hypothetical protein EYZ11_010750 [Aspergillus tanneri]|uniref:Uncharacterized protein n=1 Tax=Aspergillus tanneri TaxID=1220188 RepID=A0A4S3J6P5_9EURO|nr:hypothetical protein EYZ11_010750 [Aspergillus tanneri]